MRRIPCRTLVQILPGGQNHPAVRILRMVRNLPQMPKLPPVSVKPHPAVRTLQHLPGVKMFPPVSEACHQLLQLQQLQQYRQQLQSVPERVPPQNPALHPGQSAAIYLKGERIGFVGVVHPELERKLDLNGRTLVFELEWNKLADRVVPQAREISRFPANRRDIAVVVAENVPAADILSECKKVGVNQVVGVNLFDVYRGKGVAEGYKSLAISLILQDTSRTLEEEEIAATVAKCVEALKERFQASLRD